jgi:hypothetical protein
MKEIGIALFLLGIIGIIYFQTSFDTSVVVNYDKTGYSKPSGFPDRVNNIGLMKDKQNYTIISLGTALFGIILFVAGKNKNKVNSKDESEEIDAKIIVSEENESNNVFFCKKCGHEQELDEQEMENKRFYCCNCNVENLI